MSDNKVSFEGRTFTFTAMKPTKTIVGNVQKILVEDDQGAEVATVVVAKVAIGLTKFKVNCDDANLDWQTVPDDFDVEHLVTAAIQHCRHRVMVNGEEFTFRVEDSDKAIRYESQKIYPVFVKTADGEDYATIAVSENPPTRRVRIAYENGAISRWYDMSIDVGMDKVVRWVIESNTGEQVEPDGSSWATGKWLD